MLDRVITRNRLLELVDELALTWRIVGPVRRDGHHFYEQVARAGAVDLDFPYCTYSPKGFLFPSKELLFSYELKSGSFATHPQFDKTPTALIGVHPCDVNAIRLLDHVFTNQHRDEHYLTRRRNTLIVAIDCPTPCTAGVYCRDMGANDASAGFDLMCYPLSVNGDPSDRTYGVVYGSNVGRELVVYAQAGNPPSVDDERTFERYRNQKQAAFPASIPVDADTLPELLGRSYDSLLWEATARRCYSCGSCNLVCPTCYCFNVYDEPDMNPKSGERRREWDGCQLREFTEVAGGHTFRSRAASRLRHRIFRKGKWIKEREGIAGCVGCARCDRACTAKISTVEIYKQLAEGI